VNRRHARLGLAAASALALAASASCRRVEPGAALFQTADACTGCHNGLRTPAGEDVSIAREWMATMMANSARDPYWQASVRREIIDHGDAQAAIEDECSICHTPMATFAARALGTHGVVFAHLAPQTAGSTTDLLAADGVSCTVCHQIERDRLGSPESFTGRFAIDTRQVPLRSAFGRFAIDAGRARIMSTASGFLPAEAQQIRQAELCATCHTLFTGTAGSHGRLPEQVPYLEWLHSDYRSQRSCQSCHMPRVAAPTPIASVVSVPRPDFARHSFTGANFFMMRVLAANDAAVGMTTPPDSMRAHADETIAYLQRTAAKVTVEDARPDNRGVVFTVRVDALAGHKLPTAYPSRRAWLHVNVRDSRGRTLFESGAMRPNGAIAGNDNDDDATRFEAHYQEIVRPDQVQIYESIMIDDRGSVTTGLLSAVDYIKDNRLLPTGFDKATVQEDAAVRGEAMNDADFTGGSDRLRYVATIAAGAQPPFSIDVELCYQPIGFRWAQNLRRYRAAEPARFVSYYEAQARLSAAVLARAKATIAAR